MAMELAIAMFEDIKQLLFMVFAGIFLMVNFVSKSFDKEDMIIIVKVLAYLLAGYAVLVLILIQAD